MGATGTVRPRARGIAGVVAIVAGVAACNASAPPARSVTVDRGAYNPAISPDGSTIAVGLLGRIWLVPMDGGEAEPLTTGPSWDHHPAWSPDGTGLAYVRDMPASSEIVLHSFATGTSRTLYGRSPSDVAGGRSWGAVYSFGEVAFHPVDGTLHFVDFRSGIWSVDPNDARRPAPELQLDGSGRIGRPGITERSSFAFSPDGASIVVERDTTDQWTHVHVTPMDSVRFTQITEADTARRTELNWSGDGESIAYIELNGVRESLVIRSARAGRVTRTIDLGPFNGTELALHPDGRRAVIVSGRQLFTVDLASGTIAPIPFEATLALPARESADLVITNARLFDGTGSGVIEGATIDVRDGRIRSVSTDFPRDRSGVRVIDARGRFLMPGLVESHSHVWGGGLFSQATITAMGITSVFDPGSYLSETLNLRDAIELGVLGGPHIYTSGPTIDGAEGRARPLTIANVTDPAEARALVRELAKNGVHAIKLYAFLEPDAVAAVIDEAHTLELPVIGDLVTTPWQTALEAGIDGFVHVMDHKWRFIASQQPDPDAGPWAVVDPDSARMNQFFADVAERGAMFDPTLMASSQFFEADTFAAALETWSAQGAAIAAEREHSVRRTAILADMMRAMHRNGVRWVAGTDAGASRLLDELEIYEAIGIPNAAILESATSNAARWLKQTDFGTVESGKRADLILVDGDPLARIADLANVVLVVQSGRIILEK